MRTKQKRIFSTLVVLPMVGILGLILTEPLQGHIGGEEWSEAGQLVMDLSVCWNAEDYEGAKDLIDAKLLSKPGWLPAKVLESAYYRYIEGDSATAASVLQSIEGTVNALDPNEYVNFIAGHALYKSAVEAEGTFTQEEKEARLELAHRIFHYFPGAEIVALYFLTTTQ